MARGIGCIAPLLASVAVSAAVASCTDSHAPSGSAPGAADVRGTSSVFLTESDGARARVDELRVRFVVSPGTLPTRARRAVARSFPVLGAGVAARFERTGDGHVRAVVPSKRAALTPATVAIGAHANGDALLEDDRTHVALTFRLRGASDADIAVANGLAVYAGALDGNDVVHRPRADGTEDFVVYEARPPREELTYDVDVSRVAGLRLVSNTLEFLDAGGAPRLRIAPPYVVDAGGRRRHATLGVDGCAYDTNTAGPWGRAVTPPGATSCVVHVGWTSDVYPLLVDPAWTTTGSMAEARGNFTATLLNSGKVLVAGGMSIGNTLASAELFDGTSSFAATGSMVSDRALHTATLLPSGKVLVAGGSTMMGAAMWLAAAELFDGTGTFTSTGAMKTARQNHSAALLASGKVLITGGDTGMGPLQTAELYNGTTSFALTGSMTTPRTEHASIRLQSGKVLVLGGQSATATLASAELFDGTSTFAATGSMTTARTINVQTNLLPSGKVLVTGGMNFDTSTYAIAAAELFDGTSKFAAIGSMTAARVGHTATLLPSGKVLAAGGSDANGNYLASAEVYDGVASFAATADMNAVRAYHSAVLLPSGKVLVAGGIDNITGYVASAELYALVPNGGTCTTASECVSGVCDDGVCCSGPCNGTCQTCTLGTGACVTLKMAADPDTCFGANSCDATGACKLANGQASATPSACASGLVSDGVCCSAACGGACDACTKASGAAVDGTCAVVAQGSPGNPACGTGVVCDGTNPVCPSPCVGDVDCATGYFCASNGTCTPSRAQGQACNVAAAGDCKVAGCRECTTGHCADGVCCDTACDTVCYACAAALKESGADGTCGPVALERPPPRSTCPMSQVGSCGPDGMCNGAGQCNAFAPSGTPCGATSCSGGSVTGATCNGSGACTAQSTVNCSPYACSAGACATSCAGNSDCAAGFYCSQGGACVPKATRGTPCSTSDECATGFCVDGFCCTTACTGQCEACGVAGSEGNCTLVSGIPRGSRPACLTDGTACGGTCDGTNRQTCAYHDGTSCGSRCSDGLETDMVCNSQGTCAPSAPKPCLHNIAVCDGTACKASCTADTDCVKGSACASGECVPLPNSVCDGAHTVKAPNGTNTDCTPYDCEGDHCKTSCASINDCAPGNVCDTSNHCVPVPSTDPGATGGCAATGAAPGSARNAAVFGILLAVGLFRARRPSRARRHGERHGGKRP